LTDGSVLYVSNQDFNTNILDKVKNKIILVMGCQDEKENILTKISEEGFFDFLRSEKILHCFIQNVSIKHPKITIMPIGIDYMSYFVSNHMNEVQQNDKICQIYKKMLTWEERTKLCYGYFHIKRYQPNQIVNSISSGSDYRLPNEISLNYEILNYNTLNAKLEIPKDVIHYEYNTTDKIKIYNNMSKYLYVVCPYNYGSDTYYIWEALLMNCIPIVLSSENDVLYEKLPILIIKNWSDITIQLLHDTYHLLQERFYNMNVLKIEYWSDRILSHKRMKDDFEPKTPIYKIKKKYFDKRLTTFSVDEINNEFNIYFKFI